MRTFKFYIVLFLFSSELFSQLGPGYLGRRFQAGYGFNFSPALLGSNGSEASILGRGNAVGGDMAFNSIHDGFIEFAFKNRTSIGFSCKYYKTTFDNYVDVYMNTNYNGNNYTLSGYPTGFYTIKGLNYTLYFKFYNKRYVAPWGRYFMLGPSINTYKCFYDPSTMRLVGSDYYNSNTPIYVSDFGPQGQQFARGDILFGWGRTRMAGNRITIDYGINFEVFALGWTLWDSVGEDPLEIFASSTYITNVNYFERTSKRRVREVNRFNVFIKVGVLLF